MLLVQFLKHTLKMGPTCFFDHANDGRPSPVSMKRTIRRSRVSGRRAISLCRTSRSVSPVIVAGSRRIVWASSPAA